MMRFQTNHPMEPERTKILISMSACYTCYQRRVTSTVKTWENFRLMDEISPYCKSQTLHIKNVNKGEPQYRELVSGTPGQLQSQEFGIITVQ
ncbi:hypothetical protein J6590_071485 [Homalodisca vitripennis]|nr:hypothetical protein J6590_071485 [Homalodisca vitripennis]